MKPTIYELSYQWGDALHWSPDFAARRVVGWKARRPKRGDLLHVPMQSGKVLVLEFVDVEYPAEPPDMFFGRVRDVGFDGEPPFKRTPIRDALTSAWKWLRRKPKDAA